MKRFKTMDYFLSVLGLVMIFEGVPYFLSPVKMKTWIRQMLTLPDSALRSFGAVLMVAGLVLVYLGRR
jgi:uncharacterized protein